MPAAWVALAASAYEQNKESKDAAHAQGRQLDYLNAQSDANSAAMAPYTNAGAAATNQLLLQMGLGGSGHAFDITQLPGYQQSLKQGIDATNQGLASQGLIGSGNQMRALQAAGQNVASNYYQNYINELNQMSTVGANAGQGIASINSNLTNTGYQVQNQNIDDQWAVKMGMIKDLSGAAGTGLGNLMGSQTPQHPSTFQPSSNGMAGSGDYTFQPSGNLDQFMQPDSGGYSGGGYSVFR